LPFPPRTPCESRRAFSIPSRSASMSLPPLARTAVVLGQRNYTGDAGSGGRMAAISTGVWPRFNAIRLWLYSSI